MIPDSIIEEIRNRTDVVAVIGRHVELQRSGRTWKGCCPFHGERTPSFHVYPEDKHFKCYGCGEYGDVFKFLQKLEGKEFPEVVRSLAADVGVEIPEDTVEDTVEARRRRKERAEALAACDAAARYWQARLWSAHGESGRTYLASRGISEEESRRFRLDISADEWNDLPPRLEPKEISLDSIDRAGLRVQSDRGGYDRF
ncbi:MAG: CHC2 zinc finger domain-containing protein, partial [Deltaproteobacteria bacterium]|nr:CHC2 zinc finger domain-containing protein [Deltaproteobacteria bacterium]